MRNPAPGRVCLRRDLVAEQPPLQTDSEQGRSLPQVPVGRDPAQSVRRNRGLPPSRLLLAAAKSDLAAPAVAALAAGLVSSRSEAQADTAAVPFRAELNVALAGQVGAAASTVAELLPDREPVA